MLLLVEFAPSVSLEKSPSTLKEGDTASFTCSAEANPSDISFQWFLDGSVMQGEGVNGSVLTLTNLDKSSKGKIVKCQATNNIGKSEETYSLDINCE